MWGCIMFSRSCGPARAFPDFEQPCKLATVSHPNPAQFSLPDSLPAGGGDVTLKKYDQAHFVSNGAVYVSGTIPRVTEWERGILGGMRWVNEKWTNEPVCVGPPPSSEGD